MVVVESRYAVAAITGAARKCSAVQCFAVLCAVMLGAKPGVGMRRSGCANEAAEPSWPHSPHYYCTSSTSTGACSDACVVGM